ncbi:acyl-CoA carboxylase epsilon subunit-like protein [Labedella gwakjiensis]|uniref:Acyl-CoA carboxylase epsilon subunit-like protein n=1 Tax=Labedella gwakjiensis TaxID=390269 RepID=A0A2P8GXT3_9MICO|nr:acyl-CoA carboxylase subunit epsilon [Labedella gwakjiensis]PSL38764.1 acyl-CoA carboxylase epsilon subunit-like protein [Labedella gwakjiensis]RUQ86755.1 acyl-CoA carboxylase subunit epsilon [Labedella gwakjiensis]
MAGRHAAPMDETTPPLAASVRVLSGAATPEELAAVTVVVGAQLEEEVARSTADDGPVRNPWAVTQRNLRVPLRPGPGAWRFPWV